MWSSTVVLHVVLSYCLVYGGEISDVTTVYELFTAADESIISEEANFNESLSSTLGIVSHEPSCIHGVFGHAHSRTNALGMGFKTQFADFVESNNEPNITFDVNCWKTEQRGCAQWNYENVTLMQFNTINIGTAHQVGRIMTLNIHDMMYMTHIIFTQGPGYLENEKIYFVLRFYGKTSGAIPDLFDNCIGGSGRDYNLKGSISGHISDVTCGRRYMEFGFPYDNDYLTFDFSQEQKIRIYRGIDESQDLIANWDYEDNLDVNYFSIWPSERDIDANSVALQFRALRVTQGGMVSPVFTPQSDELCLAILFKSSISSLSPELEISVLESNNREYSLDTIQNVKSGWNVKVVTRKLRDMSPIRLNIKKVGLAEIDIARIAGCDPDGEEVLELPTPISICPHDRTLPSKNIGNSSLLIYSTVVDLIDPVAKIEDMNMTCQNGGEFTSAGCACPPGFMGPKCEIGCGRNRFGQDCGGLCSLRRRGCQGLLMCTHVTGCHCAPGYQGTYCMKKCSGGLYGNDCQQKCGHCGAGTACDIYTGECSSCEFGYLPPYCSKESVYYPLPPQLSTQEYGAINVSFDTKTYKSDLEAPILYQIQFREKGHVWKSYITKKFPELDSAIADHLTSEKLEGLKDGILYEVRVLLMDNDFNKYDGDLVGIEEIITKCDVPEEYNYTLVYDSDTSSLNFSWSYEPSICSHCCPVEGYEVSWKENWKWFTEYTDVSRFSLTDLMSGSTIQFKVRAKTIGGFFPYSQTVVASTQLTDVSSVRNLNAESRDSLSVEVSWDPPRGTGGNRLQYTVSYKCVDRPACSPGCQAVSEGHQSVLDTHITLSPLLPFTQYQITVTPEYGRPASVYVGTADVAPTEAPLLSAQSPVSTNTSLTVFWDEVPVCSSFLLGYNYQLTKESESLKILESGFTKNNSVTFHNLTASTRYAVKVFIATIAGWNPGSFLSISASTSATVPEAVRNLTVYKRSRGMLGLRWAEPRVTYGQLKSFTVTHNLGQEVISHTVEPSQCIIWPDFYCYTIEGLGYNRRYNVSVSARNSEVAEDGEVVFVNAVTKESPPSAPEDLKVSNMSSTDIELEWKYPIMANGIVRSFLISVEETEKYDQDSCCQVYPFVEKLVKEELKKYNAEVSGLHPASTYFVSVSAKTIGPGPSQTLVVSTRPPHLPLTLLPRVQIPEISWLPQDKLPEVNNSDIYSSLVRANLLLAVVKDDIQSIQLASESGITDPKLDALLQQNIGKPFYFITEYHQDDDVDLREPLGNGDSTWGQPLTSLSPEVEYQLVATQVLEYNDVYNVDLRYSQPFTLPNYSNLPIINSLGLTRINNK